MLVRVVFFGSSGFAVPALVALARDAAVEIPFVVSQPDRVRGRGNKVLPTPVKAAALEAGLRVLEPERVKGDAGFLAALAGAAPDLIVVASYGQLLPKEVLDLPRLGCVNIHASLLPRYRGAGPIRQAILAGDAETGVTLMRMGEGLDDGDIIVQAALAVGDRNAGELTEALAEAGAALLLEALPSLADGTALSLPQDAALVTYAPKLEKAGARIDWGQPADAVVRLVRAMGPEPGAYTMQGDVRVRVLRAHAAAAAGEGPAGSIASVSGDGIVVRAGSGAVTLDVIGMPGKRPMPVSDFLRGNRFPDTPLT
ncbi:MAG: methionyl-tRNA formyltransferase [Clostridiales Family XIII bacterium]|jgi:methionyl-tRNA formyltransferase|nr:methionyl-tRNA formyltransferase [Clostridiales Family XIII bacterium]